MTMYQVPQPFPIRAHTFDLNNVQDVTPINGGFIQTIQRAAPFWAASYETAALTRDRKNNMQAFLDLLEGSTDTFFAYDPSRPMPWAYRHQIGAPWGSDPNVLAGSFTNSTLTFGLTNSITMTKGDYVCFIYGVGWRLYRMMETKTGSNMTMKVKPRPPDFSGSIDCKLYQAGCEMKVIGKPEWSEEVDQPATVKFQATQFIARSL